MAKKMPQPKPDFSTVQEVNSAHYEVWGPTKSMNRAEEVVWDSSTYITPSL